MTYAIRDVRFSQPLPPGYRVVWSESTEHYQWLDEGDRESDIGCDRWMAFRGAWADYRRRRAPSEER
jgi:hypothetical protein